MASCDHNDKFVVAMDFSAINLFATWERFKNQFEVFRLAKSINNKAQDVQVANLLMKMGVESIPVYNQFTWFKNGEDGELDDKTYVNVLAKFDTYFRPVKNVIFERLRFNQIIQLQGQSIQDFITALQTQADNCEYTTMRDEMVRDRIVVGVRQAKLRQHLVDLDEELTLAVCIRRSKQWVAHQMELEELKPTVPVGANTQAGANIDYVNSSSSRSKGNSRNGPRDENMIQCRTCGFNVSRSRPHKCPALDTSTKCHKCNKTGHWSKVCQQRKKKPVASVEADAPVEAEYFDTMNSL